MWSRVAGFVDCLIMLTSGRHRLTDLLGLIESVRYIPWQQLIDAIDRMIRDARQNVFEVALRVDAVKLASSCRAPDYAEWERRDTVWSRETPFRASMYGTSHSA